jgi:hypothetical protein
MAGTAHDGASYAGNCLQGLSMVASWEYKFESYKGVSIGSFRRCCSESSYCWIEWSWEQSSLATHSWFFKDLVVDDVEGKVEGIAGREHVLREPCVRLLLLICCCCCSCCINDVRSTRGIDPHKRTFTLTFVIELAAMRPIGIVDAVIV